MSDVSATRIVLAEDEAASRALLARQLCRAGYEVIACENGKVALEAIRDQGSGIVVADWMMPEMDGIELCRTVRQLGEMQILSFVYFILLTAHAEKEQIVAGLEAGADDYLTKPYHERELLARLRAGERICSLQTELMDRQLELHKANSELATLNLKLEKLANTDPLTGLANRRHLLDRFAEVWALSERRHESLGCIMFDIDRFKSTNDTYGHAAGDEVLKCVAATARRCLRRYDVLGRFGGEEFVVACTGTDARMAGAIAERIRQAIAELKCMHEGVSIPVTVSLGVAARVESHADQGALIGAADAMLYRAKEGGRNQVWIREPDGEAHRLEAVVGTP